MIQNNSNYFLAITMSRDSTRPQVRSGRLFMRANRGRVLRLLSRSRSRRAAARAAVRTLCYDLACSPQPSDKLAVASAASAAALAAALPAFFRQSLALLSNRSQKRSMSSLDVPTAAATVRYVCG